MESFVGQIAIVAFNFVPKGWLACNGQTLSINSNQALFSLISNQYGGDGRTNFALPNLNGRAIIGTGQLNNGGNYALAATGGSETVVLNATQLPVHTHTATFSGTGSVFNASSAQATTVGAAGSGGLGRATDVAPNGTSKPAIYAPAGSPLDTALPGLNVAGSVTVGAAGGTAAVPVRDPYLAMTAIICVEGIYPQRP